MSIESELKNEVLDYLNGLKRADIMLDYDGLVKIILDFRSRGLKKEQAQSVLTACVENENDAYREEVVIDVSDRIYRGSDQFENVVW